MKAHKVDANQSAIVKALRQIPGVHVTVLSNVGAGVPDLLVAYQGILYLMEIKDPKKPSPLTPDQLAYHAKILNVGKVTVHIVKTLVEALNILDINT